MRRFVLSLVVLLEMAPAGYAQQQLRGVYGPPPSVPGTLGGVYGPPQAAPALPSSLPSTVSAPDYGPVGGAPVVFVPGTPQRGQALPNGVKPTPIPDRPGYGAAVVNGHRVIVDQNTNRIFQILD
jgi:Protein of unknown function (DUF1236)